MIIRIQEYETPSHGRQRRGRQDNACLIPETDAERIKLAELAEAHRLVQFNGRGDWERNLRDLEYHG